MNIQDYRRIIENKSDGYEVKGDLLYRVINNNRLRVSSKRL
jgi:hypothetical protein